MSCIIKFSGYPLIELIIIFVVEKTNMMIVIDNDNNYFKENLLAAYTMPCLYLPYILWLDNFSNNNFNYPE